MFVRSPHAHARIVSIGRQAALAAPGVMAVLTGADYRADGLLPIPHNAGLMQRPDVAVRLRAAPIATPHYPLPSDKARFVGEPVALVVAETIAAAKDAAELLDVAYEPLPAVTRAARCRAAGRAMPVGRGAGQRLHRHRGRRRGRHRSRLRPRRACRPAGNLGAARHRRADGAAHDRRRLRRRRRGDYTIYTGSGRGVAKVRTDLAHVLGVPEAQVRCVCEDMGGNFGTRNFFYPEYALLPWAARRIGRPVKWTVRAHRVPSSATTRAAT